MDQQNEKPKIKLPKTLAACADELYRVRQDRLLLMKQVTKLAEYEAALKEHFIQTLPQSDATGIAGKVARVQILPNYVPQVEDWDQVFGFVADNRLFHFLYRQINATAIQELWDNNQTIPGVARFNAKKVSCTVLK